MLVSCNALVNMDIVENGIVENGSNNYEASTLRKLSLQNTIEYSILFHRYFLISTEWNFSGLG
jgi:hypothetical protein